MSAPSPLAAYREGLANGELRFQLCGGCDRAVFYPRVLCPFCGSRCDCTTPLMPSMWLVIALRRHYPAACRAGQ